MRRLAVLALLGCAVLIPARQALGWGESNRVAIVTTAAHLVSKEGTIPLAKLSTEVEQGASLSDRDLLEQFPSADTNPTNAIANEMTLLEAVRPKSLDPYYGYRLGMLGALVARATSPLFDAPENYQRMYDADAAQMIATVPLQGHPRRQVDPSVYIPGIRRDLATRDSLILKDYQEGTGFSGVAKAYLVDDVSQSVAAVADVWYTVVVSRVSAATISDAQIRGYVLGSVAYYLGRDQVQDAYRHYERLLQLTKATPDLRKAVADKFFDAGAYDYAIDEYKKVLAEAPDRRDVTQRLAEYHMRMGERSLSEGALEAARDSFAAALDVDRLYPDAQKKLLETEDLISQREARLAAAQQAVSEGQDLMAKADKLILMKDYARASATLAQAADRFSSVSGEFPDEAHTASVALRDIQIRRTDLQGQLINNAQDLSGAGSAIGAQRMADMAPDLGNKALNDLVTSEFQRQISVLRESMAQ